MYFVCRWREDSPFSKRVVTQPDATVLDWFRRGWVRDDPEDWIEAELGGGVYGLESIFERGREQGIAAPETVDELRELLDEYLWVESDDDPIRLGEHALRVRTDDDEVDLAYYFIDDVAAAASPERLAFLLNDTWPLPANAIAFPDAHFSHHVPVRIVPPAGAGGDAVYSVRVGWEHRGNGTNLDLTGALMFPGVSLPELVGHLRDADDLKADDARLLRELIAPGDDDIGLAMRRYAQLDGYDPAPGVVRDKKPGRDIISLEPHIAQVARYIDDFFGYDQWFLFDTRWAAAHPDLASSLLRYGAYWDPYA
ncbi:hypothetical protein [Winogradskya humida]|uniref:Uncharacterized protein n=1 Tax=Winogradskya humida TaxID=113566 RepID=A0ABQ3ZIW9_9ACTN|nr:hypothetical protein [Actinoplanes humidus]GIE18535.1 hypothetical protein Ahu01nite_016370 [Actinoplanes humidus]